MHEEDILKQCLLLSKEAYGQELERQKAIGVKADYLMKFYTLLLAVLNLSLPLIIKYAGLENSYMWKVFYGLAMTSILLGIVSALLIQRPRKVVLFPGGTTALKEVQKSEKPAGSEEWIYKNILLLDKRTLSIERGNRDAVKWTVVSYVMFVLSIILMGFFFYSVIW